MYILMPLRDRESIISALSILCDSRFGMEEPYKGIFNTFTCFAVPVIKFVRANLFPRFLNVSFAGFFEIIQLKEESLAQS